MSSAPELRPLRALTLIVLASLCFAGLSATVKGIAATTGLAPAIMARGLVGVVVCMAWARWRGIPLVVVDKRMLAVRCLIGGLAMISYYWALTPAAKTDLATAVMLLKTSPLWVALLAPLLGERLNSRLWIALVIGLVGVGVRYGFSLQGEQLGLLASLAGGLGAGVAYLSLRALARTDDPLVVVIVFSAFLAVAPIPLLGSAVETAPTWAGSIWALLLLIGVLGTLAQVLLTLAYRFGSATMVTIGGLCEVGFAVAFSIALFEERLSAAALIGGFLAVLAGVVAATGRRPAGPPVHSEASPEGEAS